MTGDTRKAIIAALTGQVTVGMTAIPVYDHVPQGDVAAVLPYVVVKDSQVEPDDTDTDDGAVVTTEVVVYSKYAGTKEVTSLRDQVVRELHHFALTVANANAYLVIAEAGEVRSGDDGFTREGTVTVRVFLDGITYP
jgi:hypothetical protein